MQTEIQFWPLKRVLAEVGLSQSEIYRQIGRGVFPAPRSYEDCPGRKFWLSTDVNRWKCRQVPELASLVTGDDFDALMN